MALVQLVHALCDIHVIVDVARSDIDERAHHISLTVLSEQHPDTLGAINVVASDVLPEYTIRVQFAQAILEIRHPSAPTTWPAPPERALQTCHMDEAMCARLQLCRVAQIAAMKCFTQTMLRYPWRTKENMRTSISEHVGRAVERVASTLTDPILLGNVDVFLPETNLTPDEDAIVAREVALHMRGQPLLSRLHMYEVVYALVTCQGTVPPPSMLMLCLFSQLFALPH